MTTSLLFPELYYLIKAPKWSTETHNITLKYLALSRPRLCDSLSTNQIARLVNCYCYGVNVIEFLNQLKHIHLHIHVFFNKKLRTWASTESFLKVVDFLHYSEFLISSLKVP